LLWSLSVDTRTGQTTATSMCAKWIWGFAPPRPKPHGEGSSQAWFNWLLGGKSLRGASLRPKRLPVGCPGAQCQPSAAFARPQTSRGSNCVRNSTVTVNLTCRSAIDTDYRVGKMFRNMFEGISLFFARGYGVLGISLCHGVGREKHGRNMGTCTER